MAAAGNEIEIKFAVQRVKSYKANSTSILLRMTIGIPEIFSQRGKHGKLKIIITAALVAFVKNQDEEGSR